MNSVIVIATLVLSICNPQNCNTDAKSFYSYVDSDDSGPYLHTEAKNLICSKLKKTYNSKYVKVKHCYVREGIFLNGLNIEWNPDSGKLE